jgi:uncharacterized membrane protein YdjX (TVP38/TMEM64 family)
VTPRRARFVRLAILAILVIGLLVVALATGLLRLHVEDVRAHVEEAGAWAMVVFVVADTLAMLAHLPQLIFTGGAVALWGRGAGIAIAYLGAFAGVNLAFGIARVIGGAPILLESRRPRVQRLMQRITNRPITTVVILRTIFCGASFLNYGLPLTPIRFRDHVIGSAIGLVPPIIAQGVLIHWLVT